MSHSAYPRFQSVGRGRESRYWSALVACFLLVASPALEGKSLSGIHQEFLKTKLEAVKGSPENQHRLGFFTNVGWG